MTVNDSHADAEASTGPRSYPYHSKKSATTSADPDTAATTSPNAALWLLTAPGYPGPAPVRRVRSTQRSRTSSTATPSAGSTGAGPSPRAQATTAA